MARMGAPAKLYKSHSLRKGGVTAMLAAGVPLPQIQLMARWVSPNMAQLYAALTAEKSAEVFSAIGGFDTLSVRNQEQTALHSKSSRGTHARASWTLSGDEWAGPLSHGGHATEPKRGATRRELSAAEPAEPAERRE